MAIAQPGRGVLATRSSRVAAARRLLQRKHRDREGLFLVDGPQGVREAHAAGVLVEAFVDPEARSTPVRDLAARLDDVPVHLADARAISALAGSVHPQGIVGVARIARPSLSALASPRLVLVLVEASDPGNAGTAIRVADAAGADAVVITSGSVDAHNPKCVRATAGSIFHLPVLTGLDPRQAIGDLRSLGLRVLGTSGAGGDDVDALIDAGGLSGPTAWVMGNEAHGLDADVAGECDRLVRIPIHGRAESLNLGTAAAVLLYASSRAQRPDRDV